MSASQDSGAETKPARPIQRRTGGRTAKVTDLALSAAARILLEEGYEAFGHRQIAAAAGVADTTIYRRWPTKAKLVLATVEHVASRAIVFPDRGTFESDLRVLADQVIAYLSLPQVVRMIGALIAAIGEEDGGEDARRVFWQGRFAGASQIVDRGIARGEVRPDVDPVEVIETMAAPIYLRLLITGGPLDHKLSEMVVRNTLAAYGS